MKNSNKKELEKILLLTKKYKRKKEKIKKSQEKRIKKDLQEKEKREKEERNLFPEKEKYYKKILEWRDEFIKTKQFKEICSLIKEDIFLSPLIIFGGGWGHEIPYETSYACWSHLDLEEGGDLIYRSGYRSYGISKKFNLEENIEIFSPIYIKKLYEHIKNGGVYKIISSKIKRRLNLYDK